METNVSTLVLHDVKIWDEKENCSMVLKSTPMVKNHL